MTYEVVMPYHLHMPSYFLGTFTEYPKLVQRLHAAGYMAFCPMQIVFKKWKGQTKEVFAPLFPGCVFVEEAAGVELFIASQGGVSFLLDAEGQKLFVCADKAELPAKFVHLLK